MHSRGNQELCFYKVVLTNFEYSVYNKNYENVGQGNTGETWSDRLLNDSAPASSVTVEVQRRLAGLGFYAPLLPFWM